MNILDKIIADKYKEVELKKAVVPAIPAGEIGAFRKKWHLACQTSEAK